METKTIEQRARTYAYNLADEYYNDGGGVDYDDIQGAYITGAENQRDIDIQRAVEWLKDNADNYANADGEVYISNLCDDFEQAMKVENNENRRRLEE